MEKLIVLGNSIQSEIDAAGNGILSMYVEFGGIFYVERTAKKASVRTYHKELVSAGLRLGKSQASLAEQVSRIFNELGYGQSFPVVSIFELRTLIPLYNRVASTHPDIKDRLDFWSYAERDYSIERLAEMFGLNKPESAESAESAESTSEPKAEELTPARTIGEREIQDFVKLIAAQGNLDILITALGEFVSPVRIVEPKKSTKLRKKAA